MHATACLALPFSPLFRSLRSLRSHQKAPLRGLALLILTSQTRPTHPHTRIIPARSPFHLTFPAPLLSCAGWYGTPWWRRTREDKSEILVKWSGGGYDAAFQLPRLLSHSPTSSSPHKDALNTSLQGTVTLTQLHSAHGWIHHPFLHLPLPPPAPGWLGATPTAGREEGYVWMVEDRIRF